ncbi:LOW QUALITY PROTEIN: mediator of RNA polymerase II transcription subunit 15a-like [Durio zibethinus]|uniref:LOW QUALITY PROTEIN: mediator of RNA polymerase II transcription subunit 15a-like n=1 Tax=Durio zibethinus TaxID=66656 RepID=A0A6P5WKA1_DURZI|nr:LOW QUALITY PROTEIN: mediator of RNA polymerase II transcription subunit 15a-like [Durio zibethinus]
MDSNSWRPTPPSGEPTMDAGDWRTQLQPDSRQRIVNKIMDTLKRHLPFSGQEGLNELRKIALRFEEKIFTEANSQSDYLRRISLKMLTMENKSQNTMPNFGNNSKPPDPGSQGMQNQVHSQGQSIPIPLQSNQSQARQQLLPQSVPNNMSSAGVQSSTGLQSGMPSVSGPTQNSIPDVVGQNSNMQNLSEISQNSLGQGISSNIFTIQQRQMQGRQRVLLQQQQQQQQQLYPQQLQQQLMKQKIQQGNLQPSLMQFHMPQQQQQNLLPPTQLQSCLQSGMQTSSVMQPSAMQSTPLTGLQKNQQSSLQESIQSMLQQHQQPQSATSVGILQQQTAMTQQSMMPQQQQQPPQPQQQLQQPNIMGQQTNAANIKQNQLIGQQNSIVDMQQQRLLGQPNNLPNLQRQQQQHQLMAKQNLSNIHQQQLGPQSNISGLQQQQQQQLIGTQLGNSSMQTNEHMLPQPKVSLQQTQQSAPNLLPTQRQTSQQPSQQQQQQQLMSQMQLQSTQLQQQLGLQQQPNQLHQNMQPRLHASGQLSCSLLQSQNLIDQQKHLYQSRRAVPETSSTSLDSTAQSGHANGGDWQEEVYQKIKAMKETYLPELNEMYQKIAAKLRQHDSLPQQPKSEQLEKLKMFKIMLEHVISFLSVPKASIAPTFKDKLSLYEKQIVNILNTNRPRKAVSALQQGQLLPPDMHSMPQPQPQINQTQSHDNQMIPQLQSTNLQGFVPTMQPNNMTSLQHNSVSSLPGVATAQQTMLNSLHPSSNLDAGQGNALGSMQQAAAGPLQQNPVSTSQQANINSLSSQSGLSVLLQNTNPFQSNSNMLQHQHMKQQQEQQMLQSQMYKQQFQLLQMQRKLRLLQQLQQQQQKQLHEMDDINDVNMRQGIGVNPGVLQANLSTDQLPGYSYEHSKPSVQFHTSSTPRSFRLHLSAPTSIPRWSPYPSPENTEKSIYGASSLSNNKNISQQQGKI